MIRLLIAVIVLAIANLMRIWDAKYPNEAKWSVFHLIASILVMSAALVGIAALLH